MLILCGLNKLIPDLGAAMAQAGLSSVESSMGAAIGLYNVFGPIVTELKAFEILFGVQAVTIAGSGVGSGEGSRTFRLAGEEENIHDGCARHRACMYKEAAGPDWSGSF